MDIFYNKTVTIWNRATSDDVLGDDEWYPTVISGVRIRETQGANITTTGLKEADKVKLHIMTDSLPKPYLDPLQWESLDDKSEAFTLQSDKDFFVVGDVSDVEQRAANFYDYMEKHYDGVFRISTIDKYEVIPHFEVGGQ